MLNKWLYSLLFIFFIQVIGAQVKWERTYGALEKETASAIINTLEPGYIIAGNTSSFLNQTQAYIIKIDELGAIEWSKTYGGASAENAKDIVQLKDSGYLIVGLTNSFGKMYQGYVLRIDKNGELLWQKNYGGDDWEMFHRVALLSDTTFVVVGETYSYGAGSKDAYVLKCTIDGDTLWSKTYGDVNDDIFNDVLLNQNNEIVVVGSKTDSNGLKNGLVNWYTQDGTLIKDTTYGDTLNDEFLFVMDIENGDLLVSGGTEESVNDYAGWIVRLDQQGLIVGEQIQPNYYTTSYGDQYVKGTAKYKDKNYCVGASQSLQIGVINSFSMSSYFLDLSSGVSSGGFGNFIQKVNATSHTYVVDVDTCKDGGYIYCMYSDGRIGPYDIGNEKIYVIKVDSMNNTSCGDQDGNCVHETYDANADLVGVNEHLASNDFSIYPNPSSGMVVTINSSNNIKAYAVKDALGRMMLAGNHLNSQNVEVQVGDLLPGNYFITILFPNCQVTKKLIVTR